MDFHLSPLYNKALQEQHLYLWCGLFLWPIKHLVPYRKRPWNILVIVWLTCTLGFQKFQSPRICLDFVRLNFLNIQIISSMVIDCTEYHYS